MTVLYVVEHYYPYIGGVEKLFQSLAEKVSRQGHKAIVITTRFRKGLPKRETLNGVEIIRIPVTNRFAYTFFGWLFMFRQARKADLVHTTSFSAAFPAYVIAKLTGTKCIITFHELWGRLWFKLPYLSKIQRYGFYWYEQLILQLRFDRYVAVSNYTRRRLNQVPHTRKRLNKVPNGLDEPELLPQWKAPKGEYFTYTFFGRLGVSKGLDLLIKAASRLNREFKNVHLNIVIPRNPKGLYNRILKEISDSGLTNYQLYHELNRDDLKDILLQSDCVVIPSYSEGFGFSAAECAAMGIPLVSSQRGALKEVVYGKVIRIKPFSARGLYQALIKAKKREWQLLEGKPHKLKQTVKRYLSLYNELTR